MKPSSSKHRPIRNYFSRREQWRLLVLIMGLGLVIVMMREAAREENWVWLTGQANTQSSGTKDPNTDYDTAYQPTLPPRKRDGVRITSGNLPPPEVTEGYFPGVVSGYLDRVEDNRTHQHPEEAAAWFNLWQVLRVNDDEFIDPESTGPVTFGELFEQPDVFRGKLVTVEGTVRRAEYVAAAKNNRVQLEGYYRLVLRLRGGDNRPVFLYTLQLPEKFPLGDKLDAHVKASAFFYKLWLYSGHKGHSWIAPVLLAKSIRWKPTPPTGQPIIASTAIILTLGLAMASILVAWWLMKRSNQIGRAPETMRYAARSSPDINPEEVEQSARDHLRDLASRETSCDS